MDSTSDTSPPNATVQIQSILKRELRAQLAAVTGGLAPEPFARAWWDWYLKLSISPEKRGELAKRAVEKSLDTWQFAASAMMGSDTPPAPQDRRFSDSQWNRWPFSIYARAYVNWQDWWNEALTSVPGVDKKNEMLVGFLGTQMLQAGSPANYLVTNPELLEATRKESGLNLVRGFQNWLEDVQRMLTEAPPPGSERFKVGENVALTPGKVVLRNELMELIQYAPQTPTVYAEPILITPAWIMKYYILDLSPKNSLIRYLIEKGHTVFVISWKNPTSIDRELGMDQYFELGFSDALDAVSAIIPGHKTHVVGYCIGGTLGFIGTAALAQRGDERVASLTAFAALSDFSEPGELSVFIDPAQVSMLDAMMEKKGFLDGRKMAAAFQLLRSHDLMWLPLANNYIRGKRDTMTDLMAWNADLTRMPWRMHTEYLQKLYLENQLVQGRFEVQGTAVSLQYIQVPTFVVGTETDHVAPWRSVYKLRESIRSSDYTFLLTSSGHNAGIICGPENPKRRYRSLRWENTTTTATPDEWYSQAAPSPGSWWPTWQQWLADHSSAARVSPPKMGNAQEGYWPTVDAPGEYVVAC